MKSTIELPERELKELLLGHNYALSGAESEPIEMPRFSCYAPSLLGSRMVGLDLEGCELPLADLRYARLIRCEARGLVLRACQAYQVTLNGSQLKQADLSRGRFVESLAVGTSFQEASMELSYWTRADLRGADLRGAKLRGSDFTEADLREADLRGADMRDCELVETDLRGARTEGADFQGCVNWGALGWEAGSD